jgi:hypothetical protein
MGVIDKFKNIWKPVTKIGTGIGRVMAGDWTGFQSIHAGVTGLFEGKDMSGVVEGYGQTYKPDMNLLQYRAGTSAPGSAGRISALGDTDRIPDWSRNQAVAMYYLNMINKITTQGSDRKGA